MIRLRRGIDRALAHRWLRLLLIVFLVGLLALVFFHTASDGIGDEGPLVCMAVIVLLFLLVVPRQVVRRLSPPFQEPRRGPPLPAVAGLAPARLAATSIPLRR